MRKRGRAKRRERRRGMGGRGEGGREGGIAVGEMGGGGIQQPQQ